MNILRQIKNDFISEISSFFKQENFLKIFIISFLVYFIALYSLIRGDILYIDDYKNSSYAYSSWNHFSRYVGTFLLWAIRLFSDLADIAPFGQFVAMALLSLASMMIVYIFQKRLSILGLFATLPLGLSPYFLENFSYRYESLFMAFSIFIVITPFLFMKNLLLFSISSIIALLLMYCSYQASNSVYLLFGIYMIFYLFFIARDMKRSLYFTLSFTISFIIATLYYKNFIVKSFGRIDYVSPEAIQSSLIDGVINNALIYLGYLYSDLVNTQFILLCIVGMIVFIFSFANLRGHSSLGMQCNRFAKHLSLGNHSADFENFEGSQTISLASPSKFSKNYESTTANIRMLGDSNKMEGVDSKLDSSVESSLVSKDSIDSKRSLESNKINPHEVRPYKSVVGGGGESCERGGGERLRNLSPLPLSQGIDRIGDNKAIRDSKELEDSKVSSVESRLDSKASTKSNNLDSTPPQHKDSKKPFPKIILLLAPLVFLSLALPLSYGAYLALEKPLFAPRAFIGVGFLVSLICMVIISKPNILKNILVVLLSYSCIVFALAYGNALDAQMKYVDFRSAILAADLSHINSDKKVVLRGNIGYALPTSKFIHAYGNIAQRLMPKILNDDTWTYHVAAITHYKLPYTYCIDDCLRDLKLDNTSLKPILDSKYHSISENNDYIVVDIKDLPMEILF